MSDFDIPPLNRRHVSKSAIESLAAPVGRIITAWTFIDQNIEMWLRYMRNLDTINRRLPTNFESKVKFIRRATGRANIDPRAMEIAFDLLRRIKKLAEIRHTLAHWVLSHFDEDREIAVFTKLEHDPFERPGLREIAYSLQFLRDQLDEILRMAGAVQQIVAKLSERESPSYVAEVRD